MALDPTLKAQLEKRGMFGKVKELEAAQPKSVLSYFPKALKETIEQRKIIPEPIKKAVDVLLPKPKTKEEAFQKGLVPIMGKEQKVTGVFDPLGFAGELRSITGRGLELGARMLQNTKLTNEIKGTIKGIMEKIEKTTIEQEAIALTNKLEGLTKTIIDSAKNNRVVEQISNTLDTITEPQLKVRVTKEVAEKATMLVDAYPDHPLIVDSSKRIFRKVAEYMESGEIIPESLPSILRKYNLSPRAFAEEYANTITTAGKQLQTLSQLGKQIKTVLVEQLNVAEHELPDLLQKNEETIMGRVHDLFSRIENTRRGLLVSQLATAVRNAISQGARFSMQFFDDVLTGVGQTVTGKASPRSAFVPALEDLHAVVRSLTKEGQQRLGTLLESFPEETARLFNRPVGESVMEQKVVQIVNFFNSTQEYFYRKLAFDARITSNMIRNGIEEPTETIFKDAVNHALELTFAKTPKGGRIGAFYKVLSDPVITALGNPFPRFWMNALKFLWDFNPTGFTRFLDPKFREAISRGSPEAYSSVSKALLGTGFLSAAVAVRNSDFGGERWYEIKTGEGKYLDTRAFAPFSTYLFLAEAMKEDPNLSGADYAQGILSINRIAGTGLVFLDVLRGNNVDNFKKIFSQVVGTYLGGFTVPFRTLKDFIAQADPNEATYPYSRENPFLSPIIGNIPYLSELLPETPNLLKEGPLRREEPLLRQLTGLTVKTKNILESEVDRLGIISDLYPKTGVPKIDRLITAKTGELLGTPIKQIVSDIQSDLSITDFLERSQQYQQLNDLAKEELIKKLVGEAKKFSRTAILKENAKELAEDFSEALKDLSPEERIKKLNSWKSKGLLTKEIIDELTNLLPRPQEGSQLESLQKGIAYLKESIGKTDPATSVKRIISYAPSFIESLTSLPKKAVEQINQIGETFNLMLKDIAEKFGIRSAQAAFFSQVQTEFDIPPEESTTYCVIGTDGSSPRCQDIGAKIARHVEGYGPMPGTGEIGGKRIGGHKSTDEFWTSYAGDLPQGWGAYSINNQYTPEGAWFEHNLKETLPSMPSEEREYGMRIRIGGNDEQQNEILEVSVYDSATQQNLQSQKTTDLEGVPGTHDYAWHTYIFPETFRLKPEYNLRFRFAGGDVAPESVESVHLDWYELTEMGVPPPPPPPEDTTMINRFKGMIPVLQPGSPGTLVVGIPAIFKQITSYAPFASAWKKGDFIVTLQRRVGNYTRDVDRTETFNPQGAWESVKRITNPEEEGTVDKGIVGSKTGKPFPTWKYQEGKLTSIPRKAVGYEYRYVLEQEGQEPIYSKAAHGYAPLRGWQWWEER